MHALFCASPPRGQPLPTGCDHPTGSWCANLRGQPPNWYLNLVANPEVEVETRLLRGRYRARVLSDAEESALRPKLEAIYPTFARYRLSPKSVA